MDVHYIEQITAAIENNRLVLPVLPEIALKARQLCNDPKVTVRQLTSVLNQEPSMVARLLKVANSAAARAEQPITDVSQAIVRLGYRLVSTLVTSMSLMPIFQSRHPLIQGLLREEWEHSISVGSIAFVLAKTRGGTHPETAMLAGLLHDIGKLPLLSQATNWPGLIKNQELLDEIVRNHHSEVGARILELWQLPRPIVIVALNHHKLVDDDPDTTPLTDIIRIADFHSHHYSSTAARQPAQIAEDISKLGYDIEAGLPQSDEDKIVELRNSFLS